MENTFSQRLKALRQRRGLTQQELADRLGVSNKSVSRWESGGYPDVPLLVPLAPGPGSDGG
ncbi:helix-turn-helix transcriptional regulator [uncultured Intestinimonas sp.]|uniref:helix-turn-helix transcriptional regulator n=1 Tax=uncultured Intestinimonas sp. TaxID=1689265 RepID=UPI0026000F77|nr:helix-turn-helix transcriptional regulator [uncultured Intestinimonas sp.]